MAEPMEKLSAGAPLRALGILVGVWIAGRILWTSVVPDLFHEPEVAVVAKSEINDLCAAPKTLLTVTESPVSIPKSANFGTKIRPSTLNQRAAEQREIVEAQRFEAGYPDQVMASEIPDKKLVETNIMSSAKKLLASPTTQASIPIYQKSNSRWTGYFWLHARQNSLPGSVGERVSLPNIANRQYGGSQAGAIFAYRILGGLERRASLYGRISTALSPLEQEEIAVGVSVKPIANLPVAIHAEHRRPIASKISAATAIYLVGGFTSDQLIDGVTLESYVQTGIVRGATDSYFYDASATLKKPSLNIGDSRLSAGVGVWAGGQDRVSRLDVGPRLSWNIPVQGTDPQISLDWRFRIDGKAEPSSGLAVTISTAF